MVSEEGGGRGGKYNRLSKRAGPNHTVESFFFFCCRCCCFTGDGASSEVCGIVDASQG